jgi:hypothetical protein
VQSYPVIASQYATKSADSPPSLYRFKMVK